MFRRHVNPWHSDNKSIMAISFATPNIFRMKKVRSVVLLLVGFALVAHAIVVGSNFVESAIERVEYWSSTCVSVDEECRPLGNGKINLGKR